MRQPVPMLLLLLGVLLPASVWAQVVPGPGGGGSLTLPETVCVNQVATALSAQGVLTCNPVTPAMTTGLAPTVDLSPLGQVLSTHLTVPLPPLQGGTGLSSGNTGGVVYFSGPTSMDSTPTLPQHAPLFGGGAGAGPQAGTRSGTTLEVATVAGPHQVGKQLAFDVEGNLVASAFDVGMAGGGEGGAVASVFGRTGNVIAQTGDYSAGQVTNAADRSAANIFTHPSGQSMYQLQLLGAISGVLTVRAPTTAGGSLLIFPQGVTDFTTTGGPGQVVRQSTLGGALLVGQLALSDISGTATLCSSAVLCPGYQGILGFTPEDISNKSASASLGTSPTLYPTQGAVKSYVDTGLAGKQATLGFTPEDVANKASSTALGTSNTAYPTQGAVKSYVDTGLAGKQATLGFTPEDVANKSTTTTLGTSNAAYPTQNAVKAYVDTGLAGKQGALTAGAGVDITGGVIATLSTKSGFLANGGATALTCGSGTAGRFQVLANGEVQYCDGAAVPLLRAGVPTQSGLRWNVTSSSCTGDANAGKLTINLSGDIICASDIGGAGGPGGDVASVFGRTGTVVAQPGDYTAAQVTNAADLTAANIFTHATGQTMARLILTGSASGTLSTRPPAVAGASILTWPAGTTDFTTTGGVGQVLRQSGLGSPFTVSQLALSDISGSGTLCHASPVCAGYQAALGFTPEDSANKATSTALGTSNTAYPTQGAVKGYVDTALAGKQNSLGFTPEDVANKATAPTLGTSNTLYPTQGAVKSYVDTGLSGKQNSLGFTPENSANKSTVTTLGSSDLLYPSQNAVRTYVDTGLALKQNTLAFTPEDVANKSTATSLGVSNTLYPSQGAVKTYVDTGLATKQNTLAFTPENSANKAISTVLGTSDVAYPSQNAVKVYVDTGLALKQNSLGFTPENSANKAISTVLGTSDVAYPSQNAVKVYVDTGLAGKQNSLGFTAVPDTRTLTIAGTANQVTVSLAGAQNLTANRAWTLSLPQNIDTAALVRYGSLGVNVAAPATPGQVAQTAGANNLTLHTLKRATDTAPTGAFVEYQSAAGASLWRVDITGTLTAGSVPVALVTGSVPAAQLPTAAADGATKGIAAFMANDFDCTAGICGLDYLNAQVASATAKGFLTSADWSTFNAKQAPLGYTAEDVSKRSTDATLAGARNTHYVTEGAIKTYVDSGTKALTNTALTPRACTGANTAIITMNADNLTGCDFVQVAELSQSTTFDLTAGTYVNGQFLSVLIFTTVQRALTFTTGAGKFAAEGITLPTFSRAVGYVLYGFRYNALSNRWALVATNQQTDYGVTGYVQTAGGPGVESGWQPPAGGLTGSIGTIHLPMSAAQFPPTNAAVYDGSEVNGRLRFDGGAVSQCVWWGPFRMNSDYAHTPIFKLQYSMTSATGAVGVSINVSAITAAPGSGVNLKTKPFTTVNACDSTPVPAVLGDYKEISCPLVNNDGMAANRWTKLQLCRFTGAAADTASTSDLEGLAAVLEYTR